MILHVGTAFIHTPSGISSSNNLSPRKSIHCEVIRAKVSVVVVAVLCLLSISSLWADELKEYIYLDGKLVAVEAPTGTPPVTNIIPTIGSFTLSTNSPSPQLSNSNRHADLTIGRTITLNWSSQSAQSCSLWIKGSSSPATWNPSTWNKWLNVGTNSVQDWESDVTGIGL